MKLPEKFYPMILSDIKKENFYKYKGNEEKIHVYNTYGGDGLPGELYNSVGKCLIYEFDTYYYLIDWYDFYKVCGYPDTHFLWDCKCPEEEKKFLCVKSFQIFGFLFSIPFIKKWYYTTYNRILDWLYNREITIRDGLFYKKGKPFFVYAIIDK
jgi:hypothetical protein